MERTYDLADGYYWLSSTRMTVGVEAKSGNIVSAPPIIKRFIGEPLSLLIKWMKTQPGFEIAWEKRHE